MPLTTLPTCVNSYSFSESRYRFIPVFEHVTCAGTLIKYRALFESNGYAIEVLVWAEQSTGLLTKAVGNWMRPIPHSLVDQPCGEVFCEGSLQGEPTFADYVDALVNHGQQIMDEIDFIMTRVPPEGS